MACKKLTLGEFLALPQGAVGYSTVAGCEEECGLCCVPQCGASWPVFSNVYASTPVTGAGGCFYEARTSITTNVPASNCFEECTGVGLVWNAGYPEALEGKLWAFLTSESYIRVDYHAGSGEEGYVVCPFLGGPVRPEPYGSAPYAREYYLNVRSSTRLFVCEDGVLVDRTGDAIGSWTDCIIGCVEGGGINNCNTYNVLDHEQTVTWDAGADGFSSNVNVRYDGFVCNQTDGNVVEWRPDSLPVTPLDRPPFPNEAGANVTYSCRDTGKIGCLEGGPRGVPLGVWRTEGVDCGVFDCNS